MFQKGDQVKIVVDLPDPHKFYPRASAEGTLMENEGPKDMAEGTTWWQVKVPGSRPTRNDIWRFSDDEFEHIAATDWSELELM